MADYYVDNSGADGDGSLGNPWNNISGHVADLAAGDTMYIRGDAAPGRTYTEAEIVCANSGSDGSPITIMPFPGEHVILKSSGVSSTISQITGDWWNFDGLKFDGDSYTSSRQIYLNGCNHIGINNCTLYKNGSDGAITTDSVNGANYITIDNCTLYDTYKGIDQDAAGVLLNGSTYVTIKNSTMYDVRGSCIQLWDGGLDISDTTIEDNLFYVNDELQGCCESAVAVKRGSATIIRRNVMHGIRAVDGTCGCTGGGIGGAVIIYMLADDAIFEENIIYDCTSGITVGSNDGIVTIAKNVFYDLVTDANAWLNTALYIHANPEQVQVYNNTFVECPEYLFYFGSGADAILRNNLAYETHDIYEDAAATVNYDYNGWFNCVDTLAGIHDTTGTDPKFVGGGDYHLQSGSPCIDEGIDVGYPYVGMAPDLGRYEYGEATTSTLSTTSTSTLSTTSTSTISTTTVPTMTTTTTVYYPYGPMLIVNCATGRRTAEPLTAAEVADRMAIAAAAQGL